MNFGGLYPHQYTRPNAAAFRLIRSERAPSSAFLRSNYYVQSTDRGTVQAEAYY
jgi:hypothetical protein